MVCGAKPDASRWASTGPKPVQSRGHQGLPEDLQSALVMSSSAAQSVKRPGTRQARPDDTPLDFHR
jgi:hypothetical protein